MGIIVETANINLSAGGVTILDDLSFPFQEGETTVLMGPSGCGKSTLLKVMAGLMVPDSGQVYWEGEDLSYMSEKQTRRFRRRMGFLFQDGALWSNKSIFQNIELPLRFHFPKLSTEEVRRKIQNLIDKMEFDDDLGIRPSNLSLGEQKMAAFVRTLITDPEVLFLDEPTAFVDAQGIALITQKIEELKKQGRTLIVVTQKPELTARIADNIVVLKSGRMIEGGSFNKVVRTEDPEVMAILTDVLSQAASYSGDILDLLNTGDESDTFGGEGQ
jgi:phospholipid/cholesterol/gamma-HCH transport system ATP-binding protein